MNKFFKRSASKKAFTMVELLVVLAIIGVLLAMILPALFTSDLDSKGKGYAKSYYYTVQDFMSRKRVADDPDNPVLAPLGDCYFYTTTDASGNVIESGFIPQSGGSFDGTMNSVTTVQGMSYSDRFKDLVADFGQTMENNITSTEHAGTFYTVVDSDFRVQAAYWSEGTIAQLITGGNSSLSFAEDNLVSGYVCCAFPEELSLVSGVTDRAMFDYTY